MSYKYTDLLDEVHTIALIGASSNPKKDSYKVMKFLLDYGYDVYPVNPKNRGKKILNRECFASLDDLEIKIDMIDVFRPSTFVYDITKKSIKKRPKIIWTQLGIICQKSFDLAKKNGVIFVMDKCPKLELECRDNTKKEQYGS